jgi:hypothetical protein
MLDQNRSGCLHARDVRQIECKQTEVTENDRAVKKFLVSRGPQSWRPFTTRAVLEAVLGGRGVAASLSCSS